MKEDGTFQIAIAAEMTYWTAEDFAANAPFEFELKVGRGEEYETLATSDMPLISHLSDLFDWSDSEPMRVGTPKSVEAAINAVTVLSVHLSHLNGQVPSKGFRLHRSVGTR